jgi:c(7)-type cytochrome triheme protein
MKLRSFTGWRLATGGWRHGHVESRTRADRRSATRSLAATAALVLCFGAFAGSQDMPRLPGPIKMARTGDSPGQVAFKHETHVDSAQPACTACHPRHFRILKSSPPREAITHTDMDKGRFCGTCHNGKKAFALDDCAACHEG